MATDTFFWQDTVSMSELKLSQTMAGPAALRVTVLPTCGTAERMSRCTTKLHQTIDTHDAVKLAALLAEGGTVDLDTPNRVRRSRQPSMVAPFAGCPVV